MIYNGHGIEKKCIIMYDDYATNGLEDLPGESHFFIWNSDS